MKDTETRFVLTLRRPWPWAIRHSDKRVENRTWAPAEGSPAYGMRFVLHAGQGWDSAGERWIRNELGLPVPGRDVGSDPSCVPGALFADAILLAAINLDTAEIRGLWRLPNGKVPAASRWDFGPWVWFLGDVRFADRVVRSKGSLSWWTRESDDWPEFVKP